MPISRKGSLVQGGRSTLINHKYNSHSIIKKKYVRQFIESNHWHSTSKCLSQHFSCSNGNPHLLIIQEIGQVCLSPSLRHPGNAGTTEWGGA
ncbi:hypothetical protein SKAU_G00120960 [Synaphobranchus kaupii]|uniref:Uncharacterized protein n=1 Tax=Synaphobranchus kaupii TaxID=118154 RepID=A0A9Q1FNK0_SYNKA|nr:hypothetical protein SKAU_G00120960 [Synaphobranchus kaupii]